MLRYKAEIHIRAYTDSREIISNFNSPGSGVVPQFKVLTQENWMIIDVVKKRGKKER